MLRPRIRLGARQSVARRCERPEPRRSLTAHHRPYCRLVEPLASLDLRCGLSDAALRRRVTKQFNRGLHGVEVINGHDHDYERFAPQDPDGREDRAGGLREFVIGTGGVALRDIERTAPNSELRVSVVQGVLALTLRDGGYDWQFHPTTTDFSDHGTANCH